MCAPNANQLRHVFGKPGRNLDGLFAATYGDQASAFNAVQNAANRALANGQIVTGPNGIIASSNGPVLNIGGELVQLSGGRVINGKLQLRSFSGVIRLPGN